MTSDPVIAIAAIDGIRATEFVADYTVISVAAIDDIATGTAGQQIMPVTAIEDIVTVAALIPDHQAVVIEDCGGPCSFIGKTSEGIFYLDDGVLVAHNPPPGNPRPKNFEEKEPTRLHFERGGKSVYPATHCLGEAPP